MSDYTANPSALTPGPDHVIESTSSSPAIHLGPAKAIIAGVLGALGAAVPLAIAAVADGAIDATEGWGIVGALLIGGGVISGGTWITPTAVTVKTTR